MDGWISAGTLPVDLVEAASIEIGPALLLPSGRVFAVGATGNTALYDPPMRVDDPGAWVAGPTFPSVDGKSVGAKDAPAALLPNGLVLCAGGPVTGQSNDYGNTTYCFEFAPETASLTRVADPPNNNCPPYDCRMLLLPTGEVLLANSSNQIALYVPDGSPKDEWRPRITDVPSELFLGKTYRLTGQQLNGLSQAVSYGDDATMATNYPLVRLERGQQRWYCRTANHSTMAVQTGTSPQATDFTVPTMIPPGPADLVVVANGIPSLPQQVTIAAPRRRIVPHEEASER